MRYFVKPEVKPKKFTHVAKLSGGEAKKKGGHVKPPIGLQR
jgi:hypothetical protein